jgi:hypothetical protein
LQDPDGFIPRRPGRDRFDLLGRDGTISIAVAYIVKTWGFSRTRNRHNANGVCATSIVKQALKDAINLNLSEDDIIKASRFYRELNNMTTQITGIDPLEQLDEKELDDVASLIAKGPTDAEISSMADFLKQFFVGNK